MDRRDFIKASGAAIAVLSLPGILTNRYVQQQNPAQNFSRYKGFNLTQKMGGPRTKFDEEDFEIMADWGMNFARVPMSYWTWGSVSDWNKIDDDVLKDVDEVIEFGKQYNVHINLNFHRIPGYCINGRDKEPADLFNDTAEKMQKALDAAVYHWSHFAKRYKGIPSSQLSFDLINEPPKNTDEPRYIEIVKALVKGIHDEDPERLIVADGREIGRYPVLGLADIVPVQSTRGYDPMSVSHYTATWVPKDEFETFNFPTWPILGDNGKLWDKAALKVKLIDSWKPAIDKGVQVHVGEWGCYNKTPHDVTLKWMADILSLWKEAGWGHSMWNLKGSFGVLNSERDDVKYENYKSYKLDRKMLELLKKY